MKITNKALTRFVLCFVSINSLTAQVKEDSVTMGSNYPNQIYYDIKTGQIGTAPITDWHIAHTTLGRDNCIRANHMAGMEVYQYLKGSNADWANFDTTNWKTWKKQWNSINIHENGAFNLTKNTSNQWDFGWGVYNTTTKDIVGDSLYLLVFKDRFGVPNKFLKLMLIKQEGTTIPANVGNLVFRYANIDGSNSVDDTLYQSQHSSRHYKYYNFNNKSKPSREPNRGLWDITFTRYYELQPNPQNPSIWDYYPTMGVESAPGVLTAKVFTKKWADILKDTAGVLNANKNNFKNDLTGIGSNWKSFSQGNGWTFKDSQSYIIRRVRPADTSYWLIHFTNFGGATTGKVYFSRVELNKSQLSTKKINSIGSISVFPNPAKNTVFVSVEKSTIAPFSIQLVGLDGKELQSIHLPKSSGLAAAELNLAGLKSGIYLIKISNNENSETIRLMKK